MFFKYYGTVEYQGRLLHESCLWLPEGRAKARHYQLVSINSWSRHPICYPEGTVASSVASKLRFEAELNSPCRHDNTVIHHLSIADEQWIFNRDNHPSRNRQRRTCTCINHRVSGRGIWYLKLNCALWTTVGRTFLRAAHEENGYYITCTIRRIIILRSVDVTTCSSENPKFWR